MKLRWINRDIDDQQVLVDNPVESNFTEDLDSATVLLNSLSARLNIEILDEVALTDDNGVVLEYFCIGDYSETMINPKDPHYDYTISLVSQTKELEGIILPNLSVTKTDKKRSVWYYIESYLRIYGPKIRKRGPVGRLPSAYVEVDYIESSGSQYIDTGFKPNQDTSLIVSYEEASLYDLNYRGIAGTRLDYNSDAFCFGYDGVTKRRIAQYGTEAYGVNGEYGYEVLGTGPLTESLEKNELYFDGPGVHNFTRQQFEGYGSIYVCAINQPIVRPSAIKLYKCQIYQNDIMVRDFIPCRRSIDGAVGLYDLVDGMFYDNAGSGAFEAGPDTVYPIGVSIQSKWDIDPTVYKRFFDVRCPEMQWNRPTLREVLNDLMMVRNCIPTLSNGVIGMLDLGSRTGEVLSDSGITSINRSKSIEDYTTEVEMELQNVVQDSEDGAYNLTNVVEYTGFRNEEEYVLTDENARVYTKNPIYEIKHLWLCVNMKIVYTTLFNQYDYVEIDMCDVNGLNFVKEYKEYMTLPIAYDSLTIDTLEEMNQYQNFNMSYKRGGSEVDTNLFKETKKFWFFNQSFLVNFLGQVVDELRDPRIGETILWGTYHSGGTALDRVNLEDISFKIEYQCLANTKFKAGKYLPYENERVIVDNQTNSYVNASKQGILEYLKANRLGNELLMINARYDSLLDQRIVSVGSVYNDDFVIFKKQTQVNPSYVNVIYYATKHYVLRDYFTGIKAKIRSWKIESDESLVRNELHKYYYEFSFTSKIANANDEAYLPIPERVMLSPFVTHFEDELMKYGFIRSMVGYDKTVAGPSERFLPEADFYLTPYHFEYISTELNSKIMGNSIVFDTQMNDNWSAGVRVRGYSNISGTAQLVEADVRYVDDIGEITKVYFTLAPVKSINKSDSTSWEFPRKEETQGLWFSKFSMTGNEGTSVSRLFSNKPLATDDIFIDGAEKYTEDYEIRKDQREIVALSMQLEYCSDTSDIVFGSQFVKDNNLVSTDYRVKYDEVEYDTVGELAAIGVFQINAGGQPVNAPQPSEEGEIVIGEDGNCYVSELEQAYGQLYDLDATKDENDVIALGSALANKYEIGVTYTYTYPTGVGSPYWNIGFTDIPEAYNALQSGHPATDYNGKYAVAWTYQSVRMASTFSVQWSYYSDDIPVGGSIGETTSENGTYKVVKKVIGQTVGELVDLYVYYSINLLNSDHPASQNTGKYAAVSVASYTRLYVSNGSQWNWATDSDGNGIFLSSYYSPGTSVSYAGVSYTFLYNNKNYYSNGANTISWIESTGYRIDLLVSNGSYWAISEKNYTDDTTNVYFYAPVGYRMWKDEDWSDSITASKSYKWFLSDGSSWSDQGQISNGSIGYIGDDPDRISTQWYSYSSASWSYLGNTEGTPTAYTLYTYAGGGVVPRSDSVLTENLFSYGGNNYKWKSSDPVGWERNDSFTWAISETATGKYFTYDGRTYLFDGTQILYQSDRTPIRGANRDDLRLFYSNEKVRVYDMDYLPLDSQMTEIQDWTYQIGDNYIRFDGLNYARTYYLTDSEKHVLLAFNAPGSTVHGINIYLNGYCLRNKKIYN